jgi:hypothetical protein
MKIKELTTEYLKEKGFKEIKVVGDDVYEFDDFCTCCQLGNVVKLELEIDKKYYHEDNLNNYPYYHRYKYWDEYLVAKFDRGNGNFQKVRVAVREHIYWVDNYCGD